MYPTLFPIEHERMGVLAYLLVESTFPLSQESADQIIKWVHELVAGMGDFDPDDLLEFLTSKGVKGAFMVPSYNITLSEEEIQD